MKKPKATLILEDPLCLYNDLMTNAAIDFFEAKPKIITKNTDHSMLES